MKDLAYLASSASAASSNTLDLDINHMELIQTEMIGTLWHNHETKSHFHHTHFSSPHSRKFFDHVRPPNEQKSFERSKYVSMMIRS